MKISELIHELETALRLHGDLKVEIRDVENGSSFFEVGTYEDHATIEEKKRGVDGTFVIEFYEE